LKLIVGLGNPGGQYRFTRHNIGFLVVERLAEEFDIDLRTKGFSSLYGKGRIGDEKVIVAEPQTFMNLSGQAVSGLFEYFKIPSPDDLIVVHDDLDLPFTAVRLKAGGGHGGHKGLQSIMERLGQQGFRRVRLGIGRPPVKTMVDSYVLSPFSPEEIQRLPEVVTTAVEAASFMITHGIQAAMNRYHRKDVSNFEEEV